MFVSVSVSLSLNVSSPSLSQFVIVKGTKKFRTYFSLFLSCPVFYPVVLTPIKLISSIVRSYRQFVHVLVEESGRSWTEVLSDLNRESGLKANIDFECIF